MLLSILLAALSSFPAYAAEIGYREARITSVEGPAAYLYPAGGEEGLPAAVDLPIEAGDRLETGKDSRVEITLDEGSIVDLGPHSSFTFEEPEEDEGGWIQVLTLSLGSLSAKIKKLAALGTLEIHTPTAVAAVRGTEFGVHVEEGGETSVGVFDEGKVGVVALEAVDAEETVLEAKQEARVRDPKKMDFEERDGRRFLKVHGHKKMKEHRRHMDRVRQRHGGLAQRWRALPGSQRAELRQRMKGNLGRQDSAQRQKIRDFRGERHRNLDGRRQELNRRLDGLRERHGPVEERLRERRQEIRENRREGRGEKGQEMRERRDERREGREERRENDREESGDERREERRERNQERRENRREENGGRDERREERRERNEERRENRRGELREQRGEMRENLRERGGGMRQQMQDRRQGGDGGQRRQGPGMPPGGGDRR